MIARVWHGWTTRENADTYQRHLLGDVLPGIAATAGTGFGGGYVLRTERENETEFVTVLFFPSLDAIRRVAGEDYAAAYITPDARQLLARFEERVEHYEGVLAVPASAPSR